MITYNYKDKERKVMKYLLPTSTRDTLAKLYATHKVSDRSYIEYLLNRMYHRHEYKGMAVLNSNELYKLIDILLETTKGYLYNTFDKDLNNAFKILANAHLAVKEYHITDEAYRKYVK